MDKLDISTASTSSTKLDRQAIGNAMRAVFAIQHDKPKVAKFVVGRNTLDRLKKSFDPLQIDPMYSTLGVRPLWGIPVIEHPVNLDYPLVPLDEYGFPIVKDED